VRWRSSGSRQSIIESTRISAAESSIPKICKYPAQDLFIDAVQVYFAALVDQPYTKHSAAELLLAPSTIEQIVLLYISLRVAATGLLNEIVQATLETGQCR
jgi:hypothetical protein